MPKKRKITCDDLYKFQLVADTQISPDGKDVLFTLTRFHPDRKKDTSESHTWPVDAAGGAPQQFTGSSESESTPRWSPDNSRILFLSTRDAEEERKGTSQLWIIPATGGEVVKITDEKHGVSDPRWSLTANRSSSLAAYLSIPKKTSSPKRKKATSYASNASPIA